MALAQFVYRIMNQSAFAPQNLTTLPHFSVSSATSFPKSAGEPGNSDAPSSANRAFDIGSLRVALIALLRFSIYRDRWVDHNDVGKTDDARDRGDVSDKLFKMMTGVDLVHVPYRGGALALTDLIGGQVQVMFDNLPTSAEYVKTGKLRAARHQRPCRSRSPRPSAGTGPADLLMQAPGRGSRRRRRYTRRALELERFDDERLAEPLGEPLTHQPRGDVGRAAGRIADDHPHWPCWIGLRHCNPRDDWESGCRTQQVQKLTAWKFHGVPFQRCQSIMFSPIPVSSDPLLAWRCDRPACL